MRQFCIRVLFKRCRSLSFLVCSLLFMLWKNITRKPEKKNAFLHNKQFASRSMRVTLSAQPPLLSSLPNALPIYGSLLGMHNCLEELLTTWCKFQYRPLQQRDTQGKWDRLVSGAQRFAVHQKLQSINFCAEATTKFFKVILFPLFPHPIETNAEAKIGSVHFRNCKMILSCS